MVYQKLQKIVFKMDILILRQTRHMYFIYHLVNPLKFGIRIPLGLKGQLLLPGMEQNQIILNGQKSIYPDCTGLKVEKLLMSLVQITQIVIGNAMICVSLQN